jgi:hypothetical protein
VQYGVRNYKTHCVGMRLAPTVKETSTDLTDQGDQSKKLFVQCGVFHDFTGKFKELNSRALKKKSQYNRRSTIIS